ncbi:hypothetical protein BJ944DRAFT_271696 [Cunninghamella echinulata]|nr:hypothetical protein BJ944DRAFT_271696 [Cunninghamella echinulata]
MSSNPFLANKVQTLKEAFPEATIEQIEEILWAENGNVDKSIDRLLLLSDNNNNANTNSITSCHHSKRPTCHINPSLSLKKNIHNLKQAGRQTVREELAQWRQELLQQHEQRRTNRKYSTKCKDYCSSRSNHSQDKHNYYYGDGYLIRDIINESSSAAYKAVNSVYSMLSSNVNSYLASIESPSSSSSSSSNPSTMVPSNSSSSSSSITNNTNTNTFSSSRLPSNPSFNRTNTILNVKRPTESSSSPSSDITSQPQQQQYQPSAPSIPVQVYNNNNNNNDININLTRNESTNDNNNISHGVNSATTINPFIQLEHTSDADLLPPPPSYEQSLRDQLVTPTAPIRH